MKFSPEENSEPLIISKVANMVVFPKGYGLFRVTLYFIFDELNKEMTAQIEKGGLMFLLLFFSLDFDSMERAKCDI